MTCLLQTKPASWLPALLRRNQEKTKGGQLSQRRTRLAFMPPQRPNRQDVRESALRCDFHVRRFRLLCRATGPIISASGSNVGDTPIAGPICSPSTMEDVMDTPRIPWNLGKIVGQKPPLKSREVWAVRVKLQIEKRTRDLALFKSGDRQQIARLRSRQPQGLGYRVGQRRPPSRHGSPTQDSQARAV